MSKLAILTTLAMCAAALAVVPMVTPANAATSHGKHIKKHERAFAWRPGFGDSWSTGWAGWVCPGNARSFDCATWPPPFNEDPDRVSGDGGGG
jgi:hypothetical protein